MAIAVSPHHYFAIFLFIIYAGASIVTSSATNCHRYSKVANSYPVDFECTLHVEELTKTSYQEFITELCTELVEGGSRSGDAPNDVPILPNYGNYPHFFDIMLTTNGFLATVRVRRDNLYVRGFFIQTSNQWMEFKDDKEPFRHMVNPKSKFLSFGDRYQDLEKKAGKGDMVTKINYTRTKLEDAVISLAKPNNEDKQAKALIFMAQMISEAARFVDISEFFGRHLDGDKYLPSWMRGLENDWGKFSKVVQCSDEYKKYKYKEETINGKVYKTVNDLRKIFGVMLKVTNLTEKTCGIKRIAHEEEGEGVVELSIDIQ